MSRPRPDLLLTTGKIITLVGQAAMAVATVAITIGLVIIPFIPDKITAIMRTEMADPAVVFPTLPVIAMLLLGAVVTVSVFFFLDKMRRIIATVSQGDPFVPVNAHRLTVMAWLMLAIQLLAIPAHAIAAYIDKVTEGADPEVGAAVDFNAVVIVVILFILARVFRHGTAMRDDLEGTV